MRAPQIIVVGAGAGGLTAAADLARRGAEVTVIDRAAAAGGKMRRISVDGAAVDAGPTVFTMRWIFEGLFADCGARLDEKLKLAPIDVLARHAWIDGGRLDLFADIDRSAAAIAAFAGAADAEGYRAFCSRSRDIYQTLAQAFIASEKPSNPINLAWRVGFSRLDSLLRSAPLKSMWDAIGDYFTDPRLRQLFGRYATYVGSSPFLAPATLMLVAHVEQDGVWLVDGGMHAVAKAIQTLGEHHGARYRYRTHVSEIIVERGRARGVLLSDGERLDADAVIFSGDANAIASGLLGRSASGATAPTSRGARSLSAITWCTKARTRGFPLDYHNVFFADDYANEFETIFKGRAIASRPTVYVCAQDRGAGRRPADGERERLLVLINAPPDGDLGAMSPEDMARFAESATGVLRCCGLEIGRGEAGEVVTGPDGFEELFPATGGALYGMASHGANATFQRPAATTRLGGLYLAGGSVHPGAGVPMAVMSGRLAAARCLEDLAAERSGRCPSGSISVPAPSS